MPALDDLTREVAENKTVIDSAVALIQGLAQQIRDAGTSGTALADLATKLDTQSTALAAAVAANTTAPVIPPLDQV